MMVPVHWSSRHPHPCLVKEKGVTLDSRDWWQRVVKAFSSGWRLLFDQTPNPIRIIISFVCTLKRERERRWKEKALLILKNILLVMIDAHREVATNVLVKYYYEEDGDDYSSVLWGTDEDQIEFWICFCIQTMTTSNWIALMISFCVANGIAAKVNTSKETEIGRWRKDEHSNTHTHFFIHTYR